MTPSSSIAAAAEPYQQADIRMTLENRELWRSFHNLGTEMIITKTGRRMFPHCNISVSGLTPFANYVIMVDMIPADKFKYKWNKEEWEVACGAEPQPPFRTYVHPDSPAPGSHWMKQSISLLKLKLTNNTLDPHGHIILHSMHQYQPRFHVLQADDLYSVRWAPFQTFSFPETRFTAVTAYQNSKITKLKIDHNPFAKGFREEGTHGKRFRTNKTQSRHERPVKKVKADTENCEYQVCTELPRLPYDPQREEVEVEAEMAQALEPKEEQLSPWDSEQECSHSLHRTQDTPMDFSSAEQLVPQAAYSHYRSQDVRRLLSPPHEESALSRQREPSVDVATVPDREVTGAHLSNTQLLPLDYSVPSHLPPASKSKLGLTVTAVYGHYTEPAPWSGPIPAQHPTAPYSHPHRLAVEPSMPHHGHHHGNITEWSQYPLFSYSCL